MFIDINFSSLQKTLKDFKSILSKSPLTKGTDDAKDVGALLTASQEDSTIKIELAVKGFYMSSVVPGTVKESGSVVVRVDSITSLKANLSEASLSCSETDKSIKLKSGKFKADIPIHHDIDDIALQRPNALDSKHSIHSNRLSSALKCVSLDGSKDDTLFTKFVLDSTGIAVWTNSPSTAALYRNDRSPYEDCLDVVLPVDFLSSYLSKVSGKIQIAADDSVFQMSSDEINITHPLRDADIFDIKSSVEDILSGEDIVIKFSSKISDTIECLTSILAFAPDDMRISMNIDPKNNTISCNASSISGDGENSFEASNIEGTKKTVVCHINCDVVLKLLTSMSNLSSDVSWFVLNDRLLFQSSDGTISYICAQMES